MKACIKKEIQLLKKQKSHIVLLTFFSLLYMSIGYGVSKLEWISEAERINALYYFIYIYPMAFSLLMLQLYPISKDIKERYSGGIENLLCTPCTLQSIIGAKVFCIWGILIFPPLIMIITVCSLSSLWRIGIIALLVVTPVVNLGLSLIHVCNLMQEKNENYTTNTASYISTGVILILTYLPFFAYKYFGVFLDVYRSIVLAGILSIAVLCIGVYKYKKIDISMMVQQL